MRFVEDFVLGVAVLQELVIVADVMVHCRGVAHLYVVEQVLNEICYGVDDDRGLEKEGLLEY